MLCLSSREKETWFKGQTVYFRLLESSLFGVLPWLWWYSEGQAYSNCHETYHKSVNSDTRKSWEWRWNPSVKVRLESKIKMRLRWKLRNIPKTKPFLGSVSDWTRRKKWKLTDKYFSRSESGWMWGEMKSTRLKDTIKEVVGHPVTSELTKPILTVKIQYLKFRTHVVKPQPLKLQQKKQKIQVNLRNFHG